MTQPTTRRPTVVRGIHCLACWHTSGKLVSLQEYNGNMACEECGQIDDLATATTNDHNEEVYATGRAFQSASTLGVDVIGRGTAETWTTGNKAEQRNKSILDGWLRAYCGGTGSSNNTSIFLKPMPNLLAPARQNLVQILVQDARRRGAKAHTVYDVDRLRLRFYTIVAVRIAAEKQALQYIDDVLKGRAGESFQLDNDIPGILPWETVLLQINSEEGITNIQRDVAYLHHIHRKVLGLLDMESDDATCVRLYILTQLLRLQLILSETANGCYDTMKTVPPTREKRWTRADFRYFLHYNLDLHGVLSSAISLYELQACIGVWQMHRHRKLASCATACVLYGLVAPTGHPLINIRTWTIELSATFTDSHFVASERHNELSRIILLWSLSFADIGVPQPQLPPTNRPMGDGLHGWGGNHKRGIPRDDLCAIFIPAIVRHWTTIRDARLDGDCLELLGDHELDPIDKFRNGVTIAAQRTAKAGFSQNPATNKTPSKRLIKLPHHLSPERADWREVTDSLEARRSTQMSKLNEQPDAATINGIIGLGLDVDGTLQSLATIIPSVPESVQSTEDALEEAVHSFEGYDIGLRSGTLSPGTDLIDIEELGQVSQAGSDLSEPSSPIELPPLFRERELYVWERDTRLLPYAERAIARVTEHKASKAMLVADGSRLNGKSAKVAKTKNLQGKTLSDNAVDESEDGNGEYDRASSENHTEEKEDDHGTPVWYANQIYAENDKYDHHDVDENDPYDNEHRVDNSLEIAPSNSNHLTVVTDKGAANDTGYTDVADDDAEVDWDAIQAEADAQAGRNVPEPIAQKKKTAGPRNPSAKVQARLKKGRERMARLKGLSTQPIGSNSDDTAESTTGSASQPVLDDPQVESSKRKPTGGDDLALPAVSKRTKSLQNHTPTARSSKETARKPKSQPRPRKVYKNLDLYKRVVVPGCTSSSATADTGSSESGVGPTSSPNIAEGSAPSTPLDG